MRKELKKAFKLLYRSFDGNLSDEEKKFLDSGLNKYPRLRQEKSMIEKQRKALSDLSVDSFSHTFPDKIINRMKLEKKRNGLDAFYGMLVPIFRRFVIGSAIVAIILLFYILGKGQIVPSEDMFLITDSTFEEIQNLPFF